MNKSRIYYEYEDENGRFGLLFDLNYKVISILSNTTSIGLREIYSATKHAWKEVEELPHFEFPIVAITTEQFEIINGWDFDKETKPIIKDGGWTLIDVNGEKQEIWMNLVTLGKISNDAEVYFTAYKYQKPIRICNGPANNSICVYNKATGIDYRYSFRVFVKLKDVLLDSYYLNEAQLIKELHGKRYAVPLATPENASKEAISKTIMKIELELSKLKKLVDYNVMLDIFDDEYKEEILLRNEKE
jgi:hypothetical protein